LLQISDQITVNAAHPNQSRFKMARAFAEIAFTPAVRAAQARQGSAASYDRFLAPDAEPANLLGPEEAAFIAARDGFYQATVSETGWPYVQFRGGPAGFLKVLDQRTVAYADFRGNRQYVSTGNLAGDDRIAMILMDYPNRRRLKARGHARLVDAGIYHPVPNSDFTNGFPGFPTRGGGQLLWENNLGTRVTYGCVLLSDQNVQILYNWAETGVVVAIQE
jgi:predicted pyridoxine 5'-phosphate oxidase superfamily flavin-nucleotide-binding protein